MANSKTLIVALKSALKSHGLTYADVAATIDLSEASVKRIFSQKDLNLSRLDDICRMMDMEISDLFQLASDEECYISHLTEEQEKELVSDAKLLLFSICVMNRWSLEEFTSVYDFNEFECIQMLAKLDRMKILNLLPKNKVKLLVSRNFSWLPNGPIQKYFQQKIQQDFMESSFSDEGEKRIFSHGMISVSSNTQIIKKMKKLIAEFHELHNEDVNLPLENKHGMGVMLAIRPWELEIARDTRKVKKPKPFV